METKLHVQDLRISFRTSNGKVQAVRGINFDLAKGEPLAIVGESGSCKSVTSKAILGIQAGNAINGVPAGIEGLQPTELVQGMVQTALEKGCKVKEEVQSMLALSLAKAASIVTGQVLSNEEMNALVDGLLH